ncbi:hypothetical protein AQ490_22275 [Wenjunlia vitaminophila]|uniref:Transposase n=1 Tax=Wenjunlia vitaminophila TaxID=76728 RepID=A0A0T6LSK0_WENVI|nr:hypothetical protein [Wenjunlia vitaminophila]KRV49040.1 hypothetical protein AQ490_22275 [Wenjunlia vitaminophila]
MTGPPWPDDVTPHLLPPHTPELNPDELVNADLEHSLTKHRARNQAGPAAGTRRSFHGRR